MLMVMTDNLLDLHLQKADRMEKYISFKCNRLIYGTRGD